MSVHNGEAYLREAVDSILAQNFGDFEFLIVDDGSTDGTAEILSSYSDARVAVLRNERRLTLPVALNCGLRVARAPLIARADADDVYFPDRLARQMEYVRGHPSVGVFSAPTYRMSEDGHVGELARLPRQDGQLKLHLLWASPLCHTTVVYRRDIVLGVGGYDERFWTAQDYDLWARLAAHTAFGNLAEPVGKYRVHTASTCAVRGEQGRELGDSVSRRLLSKYLELDVAEGPHRTFRRLLVHGLTGDDDPVAPAVQLLDDLLDKARTAETPATLRWARAKLSSLLMARSANSTYRDAKRSWWLFGRSLRLDPRQVFRWPALKQIGRLTFVRHLPLSVARRLGMRSAVHVPQRNS